MRVPLQCAFVLLLGLGLAACGATTPPPKPPSLKTSTEETTTSQTSTATPEAQNADQVAIKDVTPPQPKPRVVPSVTVKPKLAPDGQDELASAEEQKQKESTETDVKATDSKLSEKPFTEQNTDDVINSIIWKIQSEVARKPAQPEPKIPEGQDPSLTRDALEAAFALLAQKGVPSSKVELQRDWSEKKAAGVTRVALLVPLSGPYATLGSELRRGAELALFSANNPALELLVFDTAGGNKAREAALSAVSAETDIIIGPLFTKAVTEARNVAESAGVPMLLLSNNAQATSQGSWLMGYVPEQELDLLIDHAIAAGRNRFAIIAENTVYGNRLASHAQFRLRQKGVPPRDTMVLRKEALTSEDLLKRAIRNFARYVEAADGETKQKTPPVFDALIFAGDAEFALRTAPVLAYYDLAGNDVLYLGNTQWNQSRLLMEPSLQGGLFASRPSADDTMFGKKWSAVWADRPGLLARLSFDAVALAGVLSSKDRARWRDELLSDVGFKGVSGAFRFLPGGANLRAFELRQIENGASNLLQPAPDRI